MVWPWSRPACAYASVHRCSSKEAGRNGSPHLLNLTSAVVVDLPDCFLDRPVAATVVEIVQGLVEHRLVISKYADGQHCGPIDKEVVSHPIVICQDGAGKYSHVAEVPIGPVVVDLRVVVLDEEAVVHRVEHIDKHLGDRGEVRAREAAEAAQELGRVRELVTIQTRRKILVRVARDLRQRARPGVEDRRRRVSVLSVAHNLVADREGVRCCGVPVNIWVVLGAAGGAATAEELDGARCVAGLRVGAVDELVPASEPRLGLRVDLGGHAREVGRGVKQPGVHEGSGGGYGRVDEDEEGNELHVKGTLTVMPEDGDSEGDQAGLFIQNPRIDAPD